MVEEDEAEEGEKQQQQWRQSQQQQPEWFSLRMDKVEALDSAHETGKMGRAPRILECS